MMKVAFMINYFQMYPPIGTRGGLMFPATTMHEPFGLPPSPQYGYLAISPSPSYPLHGSFLITHNQDSESGLPYKAKRRDPRKCYCRSLVSNNSIIIYSL